MAGIFLEEPAFETFGCLGIESFDRFENGDGWQRSGRDVLGMKTEAPASDELPQVQRNGERGESEKECDHPISSRHPFFCGDDHSSNGVMIVKADGRASEFPPGALALIAISRK